MPISLVKKTTKQCVLTVYSVYTVSSFEIFRCESISITYPSQSVSKSITFLDFHSVSVSETSQSVETTLWWLTWRWTLWPTWWPTTKRKKKNWPTWSFLGPLFRTKAYSACASSKLCEFISFGTVGRTSSRSRACLSKPPSCMFNLGS